MAAYWTTDSDGNRVAKSDNAGPFGVVSPEELRALELETQQKEYEFQQKKAADMRAQGLNPDGSPIRPEWQSLLDSSGNLQDKYKLDIKALDPTTWEGYQQFKKEAMRTGPSAWANLMEQQQRMNEEDQRMSATRQGQSAMNTGLSNLARYGGQSAGARLSMARSGARDILAANQNAMRAGAGARLGIQTTDEQNRIKQLADLSNSEADIGKFNKTLEGKQAELNLNNLLRENEGKRSFDMGTYQEQMKKWAAEKQAEATRNSGGGGGGCCFIFLEARYGNGTMDRVVRRYRDEHMTPRNKRGYYKVAEVLVPLMRKSKLVKFAVRVTMTDPLVSYGKWYYGEGKIGWIFAPVKNFWLKTFDFLGGEHEFIRENGELV